MNTCEDCTHYGVCDANILYIMDYCSHFIDKSDFVKVIKCKDCMHYEFTAFDSTLNKNCGYCNLNYNWHQENKEVFEDDFCSKAERK